ncbi:PREDICTED: uncharacterized protein LOC109208976 [Nicotiana attenuata]|uniref:uncharacterized protein LOC109208976 n=1 Tax=Nicotiana attenuata TaxID=49451 RepID=UPI0009052CDB|nr:PREDICTED: uncharacterized protein LOC109208976 [Nicotiana attenuata]
MSEYLDVDVDTLSYFELKDYIKELGYNSSYKFSIRPPNCGILGDIKNDRAFLAIGKSLQHEAVLEVYVHMPEEESYSAFNKGVAFNDPIADPAYTTAALSDPESSPAEDYSSENGYDESTEDSADSDENDFFGGGGDDYDSDVNEEYIEIRKKSRSFQRRKRKEKAAVDTKDVPCGDAGPDIGFDETEIGKKSVEGRLGGGEPYYPSSDACNFETDEDEYWTEDGKDKKLGIIFESVDDFRDAVTRYALQKRVLIENHINEPTRFKCERASRNYLCNSKFLAKVFKDRITEQPNIRVFKLQELIRKKFKVHVGKTTARRARAKVLQQIMGDHKVEFGRILDYMDELLRTNPGSTCVVKLGELDELGRPVFGVSRGQLLVAVAKDGNNQMLPLAWAIVEYEKKSTWSWCLTLLKKDLGLGDGTGFTMIIDMQKGLVQQLRNSFQLVNKGCVRGIS